MTNYHPVPLSRWRRWRRRLRRVPWLGLAWLAGTTGVTGWWATQPEVGLTDAALAGGAYAVLLGAALGGPWRRREGRP